MLIFRKIFWLTLLKILALLLIGGMIYLQVPNLIYNFSSRTPTLVASPDELTTQRFPRATFVAVKGTPNFDRAFVYRRYGLSFTYFNVDPYGDRLVVRTHEEVTDDWRKINRLLGKMRPFESQPFSYRIRAIYKEKFDTDIPAGAFFLSLDETPKVSGWQLGAVSFAVLLWLISFYFFFIYKRREKQQLAK